MHRFVLPSLLVVGALLSSAAQAADKTKLGENAGAEIGAKPGLKLPAASGEGEINLRKHRGSLVLVYFRDAGSPASKEEIRGIASVRDRYAPRGLAVVGVAVMPEAEDAIETPQAPRVEWAEALVSATSDNPALGDWLGIAPFELPRRFLVAPDGAVIWIGDAADDLEAAVREGLAEHPPFRNVDVETTRELVRKGSAILLDVRTPAEFADGHLEGAVNVDIMRKDFAEAVRRLPQDHEYLVYCKSGGRSMHACEIMSNLRFEHLRNLQGGITGWQEAGLPVVGGE